MKQLCRALLPIALAALLHGVASAEPFVSPMFTDNMVLQGNMKDPVWGWTDPGKTVEVTIDGKSASAVADTSGRWQAAVGPIPVGGPYTLKISGPQDVTFSNVLVGDVWVCSGQSNMEMGIGNVQNAAQEIADANYPQIRLFTVEKKVAATPQTTLKGQWDVCTPETVAKGGWNGFTAAGYFFGRELYKTRKIPIGLIHTSWGGTIAEAWTSPDGLAPLNDFNGQLDALKKINSNASDAPTFDPKNPNFSTVLYNGMIAPVIPFGIKGAIWYQGESNAGRSYQYRKLLPAMIGDWRAHWGEGNFPFYIVQLANWQDVAPEPRESGWAELREAQSMTADTVPNTGIAVIIDIGDAKDIHPKDKQDVGKRLALAALAQTYHMKVEYSGPKYAAQAIQGNKIVLAFTHAKGGLVCKGDKLTGFAIAGEDKKFVWADAVISGDTVKVSSPSVEKPVAVRYGWDNNPVVNLYNKDGLPASPFRTDQWPGVTANNK